MEQPLPHPGGFIERQPTDETLQTVETHKGAGGRHLLRRQALGWMGIDVTIQSDLRSLITVEAFVCASHLQP